MRENHEVPPDRVYLKKIAKKELRCQYESPKQCVPEEFRLSVLNIHTVLSNNNLLSGHTSLRTHGAVSTYELITREGWNLDIHFSCTKYKVNITVQTAKQDPLLIKTTEIAKFQKLKNLLEVIHDTLS